MNMLHIIIGGFLMYGLPDIICDLTIKKWNRRKCKYNCDECKNWDCQRHICEYERKKYLNENKGDNK